MLEKHDSVKQLCQGQHTKKLARRMHMCCCFQLYPMPDLFAWRVARSSSHMQHVCFTHPMEACACRGQAGETGGVHDALEEECAGA